MNLYSLHFGFWQEVAKNLRVKDIKSLRLTCKKITTEVDSSYLLNIYFYISETKQYTPNTALVLKNPIRCCVVAEVKHILYKRKYKSDTGVIFAKTKFEPYIKAIETLKNTNITLSTCTTEGEEKHYQLSEFLDSAAINVSVRDHYESVYVENAESKPLTLIHNLDASRKRNVYTVGKEVFLDFTITGFNFHQNPRKPITLKAKLPTKC